MDTYGLGLALAVTAAACVPFQADEREEERDGDGAVVRLGISTTNDVRSVSLRGARRSPADAKYPCRTSFEVCLDLAPTSADEAAVRGLCPSTNLAPDSADPTPSPWDFEFAVFETEGCSGSASTASTGGAEAGLVCYAASSFGVPGTENRVVGELLVPGANSTQVICITKRVEE